jgi:ribosomal protein S12 methylthiotransferase accessory factor
VPPAEAAFSGDIAVALETCMNAIEQQGIELLVLDQTRPDIGLPVVKVLAPGLRHFWPRFGPGRLYDVPVALGRLERARGEHELNPTPPVA